MGTPFEVISETITAWEWKYKNPYASAKEYFAKQGKEYNRDCPLCDRATDPITLKVDCNRCLMYGRWGFFDEPIGFCRSNGSAFLLYENALMKFNKEYYDQIMKNFRKLQEILKE